MLLLWTTNQQPENYFYCNFIGCSQQQHSISIPEFSLWWVRNDVFLTQPRSKYGSKYQQYIARLNDIYNTLYVNEKMAVFYITSHFFQFSEPPWAVWKTIWIAHKKVRSSGKEWCKNDDDDDDEDAMNNWTSSALWHQIGHLKEPVDLYPKPKN